MKLVLVAFLKIKKAPFGLMPTNVIFIITKTIYSQKLRVKLVNLNLLHLLFLKIIKTAFGLLALEELIV
jgi:hypothetical protein